MPLSWAGVSYSLFPGHSPSGVPDHLSTITLSAQRRLPSIGWCMPWDLSSDTYASDENTLPWSEFWMAGVPWAASSHLLSRVRPSGSSPALASLLGVISVPVAKPLEEVTLDGGWSLHSHTSDGESSRSLATWEIVFSPLTTSSATAILDSVA